MQGPINKDVTLRNAAAFPTAKSGPVRSKGCVVLAWIPSDFLLGYKNDFLKKLAKGR